MNHSVLRDEELRVEGGIKKELFSPEFHNRYASTIKTKYNSLVPESPHSLLQVRSSNQQLNQPVSDEFPPTIGVAVVELLLLVVVEAVEEE